jgi:hypothetical protein
MAASRPHTFGQLAVAVNTAFARWDHAHLYQFVLSDRRERSDNLNSTTSMRASSMQRPQSSALTDGERFAFEFDLGDGWTHLCTVGDERIDPLNELGITPRQPLPYFGWSAMPDQYGRRWVDDDGGEVVPPNPGPGTLPPLLQW